MVELTYPVQLKVYISEEHKRLFEDYCATFNKKQSEAFRECLDEVLGPELEEHRAKEAVEAKRKKKKEVNQ